MASISTASSSPLRSRVSRPVLGDNPLRSILRRSNSTNSILSTTEENKTSTLANDKAALKPARPQVVIPECWGVIIGQHDDEEFIRLPLYRMTCSIGRDVNNDIVIPSPVYSGIHCSIKRTSTGMMMVRDLSHNGMQLNDGAMAISWQPIKYGDKLSFQEYSFEFLAPKATNQMTTARSENSSTPLTEQPTRMTNNAVTSHSSATRLLQSPLAPQSAMLLSRLVASPKRVSSPPNLNVSKPTRMPALMAHQNSTFDEDADEDEGDLGEAAPPSPSSGRLISRLTSSAPTTPKRHLSEDMGTATESKKVRFGPSLSPEIFSKDEPPATPVKRGESTRPGTPRRAPTSTATLLERLKTASPAKSIIASPQSQQRTANFSEYLERPRPLKFGENTVNQPRISAPTEEGRKTNHTDMSNPFAPTSPAPKTSSDEA